MSDTKSCPFCDQVIKAGASVCRHCREDLPPDGVSSPLLPTPNGTAEAQKPPFNLVAAAVSVSADPRSKPFSRGGVTEPETRRSPQAWIAAVGVGLILVSAAGFWASNLASGAATSDSQLTPTPTPTPTPFEGIFEGQGSSEGIQITERLRVEGDSVIFEQVNAVNSALIISSVCTGGPVVLGPRPYLPELDCTVSQQGGGSLSKRITHAILFDGSSWRHEITEDMSVVLARKDSEVSPAGGGAQNSDLYGSVPNTLGAKMTEVDNQRRFQLTPNDEEADFWKKVMPAIFGEYSSRYGCWLSRDDRGVYCMRPHKLESVTTATRRLWFVSVAGFQLDSAGSIVSCHSCYPGALALLVLERDGSEATVVATNMTTKLLAGRGELYDHAGLFGNPPSPDDLTIRLVGPDNYAWVVPGWDAYSGTFFKDQDIYGIVGAGVVPLFELRVASNNSASGECIDSRQACFRWEFALSFDSTSESDGFFHAVLEPVGEWLTAGEEMPPNVAERWRFEKAAGKYVRQD